jgi:hypothetical protein
VATPHIDRVECDELACLARQFRSTAERLRRCSYASRAIGRPTESVRLGTRAWAYDEAAQRCLEQLQAGASRIVTGRPGGKRPVRQSGRTG